MNLFELTELASYLQQDLDEATATLARDLATTGIRLVAGQTRWAALSTAEAQDLKGVALDIARRLYLNPEQRRSEKVDDYEYVNAAETLGDTELEESEQDRVRRILGIRPKGAFTITPASPAPRSSYCGPLSYRRHY